MSLPHKRLVRISKAQATTVNEWKEGVSLESQSKSTIDTLCRQVAAGRWRLALALRASGKRSLLHLQARDAIGRFYYAMYHSLRAAAFLHHCGDDYEAHKDLPSKLPVDFPNVAHWANQLKSARDFRNRADYDPYPVANTHWQPIAESMRSDAVALLPLVKSYLVGKGCALK